ncbi:MAG: alpha/beta hydrolase [Bacteroidales bacterium]|nr:alpha/beta hydrolase [Bacteroidales bacterium]
MKKTKSLESIKTALICITVAIFLNTNTLAQPVDNRVVIGEKVTFKSNILDENRTILVYLPQSYNQTDFCYPVMYLLDGGFHFHHTSGIVGFMSRAGIIPEMIVIGITNVDRNRDFSPTRTEQIPTSGGAEKFLSFLSDELIPFVDRNYRTLPYEILVGHSFGGTFATYTLLNRPETFNAYIAISPYLQYDDADLVKKTKIHYY